MDMILTAVSLMVALFLLAMGVTYLLFSKTDEEDE